MGNAVYDCETSKNPGQMLCECSANIARKKRNECLAIINGVSEQWFGDDEVAFAQKGSALFTQMSSIESDMEWIGSMLVQSRDAVNSISAHSVGYAR